MKAKLVYENLECSESLSFQRSEDPKQILNIGQRAVIEDWFKDIERQKGRKIDYTIDNELNVVVKQGLWLENLSIDWLPDNLIVNGSLDLSNTEITKLPDNLSVGETLYIRNTEITELPDNLSVKGNIWISKDMKNGLVASEHLKSKIITI